MKNLGKVLILGGFLLFGSASFSQSQPSDEGHATITTDYCVSLDDSEPVHNFYAIDITHLNIESEYMAKKKFGYIANNLLTYHVDFENNKVLLEVHIDRTKEIKDVVWWNEYITSLCNK